MPDDPTPSDSDASAPEDTASTAVPPATEDASATQEAYAALQQQYLRLAADFDNFRKRQAQEREFLFKYGAQTTLETLLPVLDNLARAQQSLSETADPKMLYKSFELLSQQLLDTLKDLGLKKLSPRGEGFDPNLHEAVSQVESPDLPENTIVEVYQDGYCLHDRTLRPAKVVVCVPPATDLPAPCDAPEADEAMRANPFQQTPHPGAS